MQCHALNSADQATCEKLHYASKKMCIMILMEQARLDSQNRYNFRAVAERTGALALLTMGLLLGGCGGSNAAEASPIARPNQTHEATFTPNPTEHPDSTLTFDALGGGSKVIQVYPGPANTQADKTPDGTYLNGQTATAVCEMQGRTVTSKPADGERYKQSDEWYKLQTATGQPPEYATAVYADVSGPVPQC